MDYKIDFEKTMTEAKNKLEKEYAACKSKLGRHASVMASDTLKALIGFIEQDFEFAEAVIQNSQTFGDCMTVVAQGIGGSISDFNAFKRAVQFYFPGAEIEYQMKIKVNPFEKSVSSPKESKIFSLLDILEE